MDTQEKKMHYESPSVEVMETQHQSVICNSVTTSGNIEDITRGGDGSWYD